MKDGNKDVSGAFSKIALKDMGLCSGIPFSSKEAVRESVEHIVGFLTKRGQ